MKQQTIDALRRYVNVCFYYKGEALDSTIMEKLNAAGVFEDGFINTYYEGANYGFQIGKGDIVTLNSTSYRVEDVKMAYINDDNGVFPLYIKIYLNDIK